MIKKTKEAEGFNNILDSTLIDYFLFRQEWPLISNKHQYHLWKNTLPMKYHSFSIATISIDLGMFDNVTTKY
jgi:hypothetical protein